PKVAPSGFATFLLKLKSIELEGKREETSASVLVRWRGSPKFGDELRLFGIAEPMAPPRNPGEFDMLSYLARSDVRRILFVRYVENGTLIRHGGGNPILRAAQKSRAWMQATLCRGLEDAPDVQSFISGIVLGLRHQTPEDIEEPFQQTGTLHLFAVAGLHVGIVARLLWMLATVSQLSRKWSAALIIPLLLFYAAVTGLHVSSVRAAVMSSILLGGLFFERKVLALNSLAAAAFFLLSWDTNELFSTGFQLSFAVVGTIILLADPVSALLRRWTAPDPFLPRSLMRRSRRIFDSFMTAVSRGASVSLAAWIGSLVLLLWYFYLITPISLFANLVVVPIAFFVLAIALLSLVCAPLLPWFALVFNNANWFLARLVLAIVHFFAQLPGGHFYFAHPHWPDGAVLRLNVLDVGGGAAVHARAQGGDWLFDCGSERDYERVLRQYLHSAGVNRLRGLLLTHGDSQHIGGAAPLLSEMKPPVLVDNPSPDRSIVHRRLRALFKQLGRTPQLLSAGNEIRLSDEVLAKILYPPPGFSARTADEQSLVIQLITSSARILLMADSGEPTERALMNSPADLRSDIVVKGQNHSAQSGSDVFLDVVHPHLIIATSRDFPEYERITDEWADRIRARGIKLFRQDETGAVKLIFRRENWEARAYITGEVFRSSSR
ncbi:MAG: ComEC/Rec2 family competence protein, partial [Verrucomicrobiota bacterium]|nr:ComEC/Rec2 family competence protein [Verrucomicrobiota bacterium]